MKALFIVLLLVGCATKPIADTRPAQFEQFNVQINAQRDAKQITYAAGQQKKWDFHKSLWPQDPYAPEFFSYTIMLGERVDRGELPASEYTYLATQKWSQIRQMVEADESRRTQDAAAVLQSMPQPVYQPTRIEPYQMKRPTQTNCHTDKYGNTSCTTY